MWTEQIAGERFTAVEPTPLLAACIAAGREALAGALGDRARVEVSSGWDFDDSTTLVPSIVVTATGSSNGSAHVPDLVVEFRTESTGRYILGPKRMVYSRYRVPEFWYADPLHRRIAVLRSEAGGEYEWPPLLFGEGDALELSRFPGASLPASSLLGPGFVRSLPADDEAWLAS